MGDIFFEIIVKDETFRKIDTWKFRGKDAKKFFGTMNSKYGLGMKIKETVRDDDRDLDWLK